MKSIIFVFLLVATVTAPLAEAQLLGGILGSLLGLINIAGSVPCTANGTVSLSGTTPTPAFPNAAVQLRCGGNVVSSTTTNASGTFSIVLNPLQVLLSTLLGGACSLVVNTPLSSCNANLSGFQGVLSAPLQLIGTTLLGPLAITNIVPGVFQLINGLV